MIKYIFEKIFYTQNRVQKSTIKYAFPAVLIATIFGSLAAIITENDSYILVKTDTETITEGENFYIDIDISAHVPVNAIDLTLAYPEDQIKIENIDTGTSVITLWTEVPYAKDGIIYLRGGTFRKGFVGEHTVARIKATGIRSGIARISLKNSQLVAGDGKGTVVPVTDSESLNQTKITVMAVDGKVTGEATIEIITDLNNDGKVNISDISAFMSAWFTREKTFDFNKDGRMTFSDFSILLAESFMK